MLLPDSKFKGFVRRARLAAWAAHVHHRKPPKKADQVQAYVDQKLVAEHMRQLAESELDGSPNKRRKCFADALDRTIETGASTADMGHAVEARYKGMFGGKPLDDLDMMEQAHDAVASAKKNACKGEF